MVNDERTTMNTKTIYLDFTYEENTIEEALRNFRKEIPTYVAINLHEDRTEYRWPVIECVVPEDKALEFVTGYFGGDIEQAKHILED
jgi:hypothetical protein